MKKIILTIPVLSLASCGEPTVSTKTTGATYGSINSNIEEIEFEGCQYIGSFLGGQSDWGSHKGNCTNPIHKQNHVTVIDTVEYQLIRK